MQAGVHSFESTTAPGNDNPAQFISALEAMVSSENGRFSCLNTLLGMNDNDWWRENNTAQYSFSWSMLSYWAIMSLYGYVNEEVWREIRDEGLGSQPWFPLESVPYWEKTNHTDPALSRVKCAVWAGGDYQRAYLGNSQANFPGVGNVHKHNHMCMAGSVLLKAGTSGACEAVDPATDPVGRVCAAASLLFSEVTPLSLLWDPEESVELFGKVVSIVQFPLDTKAAPGTSYEWKASSKAPLLVYDPEHKGEITSASQLFGAWTFGGSSKEGTKEPWKDAYEALGTLDSDKDGVIKGAELAPLGLWFDGDRDAVSQPGEVKSAIEAGLIQLRYKDGVTREGSSDKFLKDGFVRKTNDGQEVRGASVDWMARVAEFARNLAEGERMLETTQQAARIDADSSSASATRRLIEFGREKNTKFSGNWRWIKGLNQADTASGFFALSSDEQGRLLGMSFAEWKATAGSGSRHMINFATMMGAIDPHDGSRITFDLVLPDDAERATSSAKLVERNGKTYLEGETNVRRRMASGMTNSIVYRWWAQKE